MGFARYVDHIFSAGRMRIAKPDKRYFSYIEEALKTDSSNIVLIDDVAENIEAARLAGWKAVHFRQDDHIALETALADI